MAELLAVGANPLLAAMLGGRAREIIFSGKFRLCSPQVTLFEVTKYLPQVAAKLGLEELHLYREFQLLPVEAVYAPNEQLAAALIGRRDPRDIPLLALALERDIAIWSNDRDFEGITAVKVWGTGQLLDRLSEE